MPAWLRQHRVHLLLFGVGLVVFGAVAGDRIYQPSRDVHFVYQAHAWLNGRLAIEPMPRGADDPAKVETVLLDDGSEVRGRRLRTRRFFRTTHGDEIPLERVRRTLATTTYNSFPPGPAILLLPQTLVAGTRANDVLFTLIFAAFVLPLGFAVMRRLNDAGLADRSRSDQIWLVVGLAFGTVLFFSAVQGRVWYTAHVVGVVFCLAYVWCAIEARHPILAGCALAFAAITRTPMAFMFPLFFFEAWRMADGDRRAFIKKALKFSAPVAVVAIAAAAHNYARFDELTEFGHSYLQVRQQAQIEQHGLFSHHYLSRNLAVAFTLLPDFSWGKPWVVVSGHGLAIWFTTPIVLLVLWPRVKGPLHRPLWVTIAFVAVPTLFYQNSGWFQFGYRFALDYMVFLFVLLAVGGRPLTRVAKALIIAGIVINLFGAYTFDRVKEHYRGNYAVVIEH